MPKLGTDDRDLLVTGRGRFIADIAPDDCVDVCFVRSPLPHAMIRSVHLGSNQATWGVELGLQPLTLEAGAMVTTLWHPLPTERVRYVGEPVAMAWGAERYEAEDLAEAITVDYAGLPPGTPLHDAAPDGVLFSRSFDSGGVDEAMARAHLVIERTFKAARQSALPLEGRGVVADHDETTGVTTLWTSTQLPHLVRRGVAHALGAPSPRCGSWSRTWAVGLA